LVRPASRLPSAYQEVEYVQRNGKNAIDTWWIPTQWFEIRAWVKISTGWVRYAIISQWAGGSSSHSFSGEINSWNVTNNTVRFYCWATSVTQFYSSNSLTLNTFNDVVYSSPNSITVNWTTTTWTGYTWAYDNITCYLFFERSLNTTAFSDNSMCISYCKIYESWTLVRDFVPCYRKNDGVIWFYELVNSQFYTNIWTWTFAKWADVN
jgi:hypothetical protein